MSSLDRLQTLAWLLTHPELPSGDLQLEFGAEESLEQARQLLETWSEQGLRFLTLADADYPDNLRRSCSPAPFLFVRGELTHRDARAVSVIGTRACSRAGRRRALKLSRALAEAEVTVVSGLALGIDTAAHEGALAAGGRTVAVVGTGLNTVYPPENRALQERILESGGAIVSQFWPDFKGQKGGANFIARNQTMADLSLATVVVEASLRSGARSQAAYLQRTGGRLLLLRSLVESEEWARAAAGTVVDEVADVLRML